MLFQIQPSGQVRKMQHSSFPQCALFEQQIIPSPPPDNNDPSKATLQIRYHPPPPADLNLTGGAPAEVVAAANASIDNDMLRIPLQPDVDGLERVDVSLHNSGAAAYRMGERCDKWFTERFGFPVMLVYLGDGRRKVLGTAILPAEFRSEAGGGEKVGEGGGGGWLLSLVGYVAPGVAQGGEEEKDKEKEKEKHWITFADVAPLLVTSESSLREVQTRLPAETPVGMYKFRPNIVVDGEGEEAWAEDFWGELTVTPRKFSGEEEEEEEGGKWRLLLTSNCARCTSLNVDYATGKQAAGELGTVLKKLMSDRRVDPGVKWSPVFGRYAFPGDIGDEAWVSVRVGDEVEVSNRIAERTVWDWPM